MGVLNSVLVKKTMLLYWILREEKGPLYGLGTVHKSDNGSDCTCPGRKSKMIHTKSKIVRSRKTKSECDVMAPD